MVCNICGANEASVHLTEIVNNQMVEIHLCETCAQEKGTAFKTHFNMGDAMSGFNDFFEPTTKKSAEAVKKCPQCSMTYEEFGKGGRLGCAACYEAFADLLIPLIKRVQRASSHVGKKPANLSRTARASHDLRMLQDRLRKCIQDEAFEEAAHVRDEIKKIQSKPKSKKKKSGS